MVEIEFERGQQRSFHPHDFLSCNYRIELEHDHVLTALEASVIWLTEGKGEEDIGVHFFERKNRDAIKLDQHACVGRLSTVLPASPLTYHGKILKIRWCVRVRLFLGDRKEKTFDEYFLLVQRGSGAKQIDLDVAGDG